LFSDTARGTDLLSGTFEVTGSPSTTGAQFSTIIGSSGASFDASTAADNVNQLVMGSAYLTFPVTTIQQDASFSLSSQSPPFEVGPVTGVQAYPVGNYMAAGTGTFSFDTASTTTPEPATFAMVGGALMGVGMLRRRKARKGSRRRTSTLASNAIAACALAAKSGSTTLSDTLSAPDIQRSCSTSTMRWAIPPAANASRRARPAR
jgi:hypothetical protein